MRSPLPALPPRALRGADIFSGQSAARAAFSSRLRFDAAAPPLRDVFAAKFADILDDRLRKGKEKALETAARLSAEKPGNIHYNLEYARQLLAAGAAEQTELARRILDVVLKLRPDNALALSFAAYLHMQKGEDEHALRLFSRALEQEPADIFSRINAHYARGRLNAAGVFTPDADEPLAPAPALTIATSLPPKSLETSRRAVLSWLAHGFTVLSVNTEKECRVLRGHFPNVTFCAHDKTAEPRTGGKHQYLDALLDALDAHGTELCALVNADIILEGGRKAWAHIARRAEDGFVFAPRVNLRNLDCREGHIYSSGFDCFVFPKSLLARVPRTDFIIGQPFWDIFLPACANLAGLRTYLCLSPIALHKTHETRWNEELFIHLGFHLLELFAPALAPLLSAHAGSPRYFLNIAGILSECLNHALRGTAEPLFCPGGQFANYAAPVDAFYWTGAEKTLIVR